MLVLSFFVLIIVSSLPTFLSYLLFSSRPNFLWRINKVLSHLISYMLTENRVLKHNSCHYYYFKFVFRTLLEKKKKRFPLSFLVRSWLNRRQIDGSLNRTPLGFYDRVWQILERTPNGIVVAGTHLPQVLPHPSPLTRQTLWPFQPTTNFLKTW